MTYFNTIVEACRAFESMTNMEVTMNKEGMIDFFSAMLARCDTIEDTIDVLTMYTYIVSKNLASELFEAV